MTPNLELAEDYFREYRQAYLGLSNQLNSTTIFLLGVILVILQIRDQVDCKGKILMTAILAFGTLSLISGIAFNISTINMFSI